MDRKRVLFLCTGNSARSLMAEAILRQLAPERFEVHSAGLRPSEPRPETLEVLREAGYSVEGLRSKPVDQYLGHMFVHYLITVCSDAEGNCPRTWPPGGKRIFWPVDDPAAVDDPSERLAAFRRARDDLAARIMAWLDSQPG